MAFNVKLDPSQPLAYFLTENEVVDNQSSSRPPILAYNWIAALFYKIIGFLGFGPGIIDLQNREHECIHLNKKDLINWINSKNAHHLASVPKIDAYATEQIIKQSLQAFQVGFRAPPPEQDHVIETFTIKDSSVLSNAAQNRRLEADKKRIINESSEALTFFLQEQGYKSKIERITFNKTRLNEFHIKHATCFQKNVNPTCPLWPTSSKSEHSEFPPGFVDSIDANASKSHYSDYEETKHPESKVFHISSTTSYLGDGLLRSVVYSSDEDEERSLYEMPELATILFLQAETPQQARIKNDINGDDKQLAQPGFASPNPILFTNLLKAGIMPPFQVSQINNLGDITLKRNPCIQNVNLLTIATPKLPFCPDREECQNLRHNDIVIKDLFITFIAGFTLAKENATAEKMACTVCTGPLGCKECTSSQDYRAIYALQMLAAQYVGVEHIHFFDYGKKQAEESHTFWLEICHSFADKKPTIEQIIQAIEAKIKESAQIKRRYNSIF